MMEQRSQMLKQMQLSKNEREREVHALGRRKEGSLPSGPSHGICANESTEQLGNTWLWIHTVPVAFGMGR